MTYPALRVEGLWKEYSIGGDAFARLTFREVLIQSTKRSLQRVTRDRELGAREKFYALKDVSFDIKPGEIVGIVGRNGAGKSTLLKILSRITAPTKGRVEIRGRIASLLEVGTGFHPELTGRENVRLNGSVLGMSQAEITRKFDEIVAFSGVEKFIDTPVKRYSSGMQVRLAFAVAAHLEPEILLIDEVLAVGDAEFQRKSFGRISDISKHGRTILFVSHQLGMIARLCSQAFLLSKGSIVFSGTGSATIDAYLASNRAVSQRENPFDDPTIRKLSAAIADVSTVDSEGSATDQFAWHTPIRIRVKLRIQLPLGGLSLSVAVVGTQAGRVTTSVLQLAEFLNNGDERSEVEVEFESKIIAPGGYSLTVALFDRTAGAYNIHHSLEGVSPFMIVDSGSPMAAFGDAYYGVCIIPARWSGRRLD